MAGNVDVDGFAARASEYAPNAVNELLRTWRLLTDAQNLSRWAAPSASQPPPRSDRLHRSLSDQLIAAGVVEVVPAEQSAPPLTCYGVAFTVVEEKSAGLRQRFIYWPLNQLRAQSAEGVTGNDMNLLTVTEQASIAHAPGDRDKAAYGAVCADGTVLAAPDWQGVVMHQQDATASFNQILLPPHCRDAYRMIDASGRVLRMRVLPMGARFSPTLLQEIFCILAYGDDLKNHRAAQPDGRRRVWAFDGYQSFCHVDNYVVAGPRKLVEHLAGRFANRAAECNMIINDETVNQMHVAGVACGQSLDVIASTAALAPKTLRRLEALQLDRNCFRVYEFERTIGLLEWAAAVKQISFLETGAHTVLSAWRSIASSLATGRLVPMSIVELRPHVADALRTLSARLCDDPPVVPCDFRVRRPVADLFTDASAAGWGAVLVVNGRATAYGERWPADTLDHIYVLEARAITLAARKFATALWGLHVRVAVDNVTAERALYNGRAKSDAVAPEASAAAAALSRVAASWTVGRIATDLNPADEPSWGTSNDVAKALAAPAHVLTQSKGFRANETLWRLGASIKGTRVYG